jgi:hypothetical protein
MGIAGKYTITTKVKAVPVSISGKQGLLLDFRNIIYSSYTLIASTGQPASASLAESTQSASTSPTVTCANPSSCNSKTCGHTSGQRPQPMQLVFTSAFIILESPPISVYNLVICFPLLEKILPTLT